MVLNAGKCYFMRLRNNTKNETFLFNNDFMKNCNEKKNLGLIIDDKLNFKSHITQLRK